MVKIFLGLGANVGDKKANIQKAVELLQKCISNIRRAPLYRAKPAGFFEQEDFLNTVLEGETNLSPKELLGFAKEVEAGVGRKKRFKHGPREIDIDILFYDDLIYKDKELEIPHQGLTERDFVLKPLSDLAPDFIHPVLKKKVKEILEKLPKENIYITR